MLPSSGPNNKPREMQRDTDKNQSRIKHRSHVPPKRRLFSVGVNGVSSHKTETFAVIAARA
jgi:hypothetical protein